MTPSFDPLRFLTIAEWLASRGTTEEEWRTACGRSYYAAFLVMRERLYPYPLYPTPPEVVIRQTASGRERLSVHRAVREEVRHRDVSLADDLAYLFRLRVEADYRLRPSGPPLAGWSAPTPASPSTSPAALFPVCWRCPCRFPP